MSLINEVDRIRRVVREGPIRHPSLPAELRKRIATLYPSVGKFISPNLEHWEEGFQRDMHPDREVRIWEDIERAFLRYMRNNLQADQERAVRTFVRLSTGSPEKTPLRMYWKGVAKPITFVNGKGDMIAVVYSAPTEKPHDGQNRTEGRIA